MGGITDKTIPETLRLGFKGIGVLGGIWNMENPVKSFLEIQKQYEQSWIEQRKTSLRNTAKDI
jgi:thiamine-phosphate pyrophosphorylase